MKPYEGCNIYIYLYEYQGYSDRAAVPPGRPGQPQGANEGERPADAQQQGKQARSSEDAMITCSTVGKRVGL